MKPALHAQRPFINAANGSALNKVYSSRPYRFVVSAFLIILLYFGWAQRAVAQTPSISYSSPQNYPVGNAITPLVPGSSNVSAFGYAAQTALLNIPGRDPEAIAVDSAGNVFVGAEERLYMIPAGGTPVLLSSSYTNIYGLAVDAQDNVYVAADVIYKVTNPLQPGSTTTTFITPNFSNQLAGIAVDKAGNIYAANGNGYQVYKFPVVNGVPGTGFPILPSSNYNETGDVAVDKNGNIYISYLASSTITEIPASVTSYPAPAASLVQLGSGFVNPFSLAVDNAGNVYVGDTNTNLVSRIDVSGTQTTIGSNENYPWGVGVDGAGNVYFNQTGGLAVYELKQNGGYYISSQLPPGLNFSAATGTISGTPSTASSVTNYTITAYNNSGSAGNAIVNIQTNIVAPTLSYTSPNSYPVGTAITSLAPTGTYVSPFGYAAQTQIVSTGGFPEALAVDSLGDVYVGANSELYLIPAGGTAQLLSSSYNNITGLAVDKAGNVYVADGIIYKVTNPLQPGSTTTSFITYSFNDLGGIAVDKSCNIYATDVNGHQVYKFPVISGVPGSAITLTPGSGSTLPEGVAVDKLGNIYYADSQSSSIQEIPASVTNYPAASGSILNLGSGFSQPNGVAVDNAGAVYVTEFGGGNVYRVDASGNQTTIGSNEAGTWGIGVDGSGNVYFAQTNGSAAYELKQTGGYYISKSLPSGLIFNTSTGAISGTPAAASPAKNYTVTAYNNGTTGTAVVNIQTTVVTPTLSYTGPNSYPTGTAITPLAPTSTNVSAFAYGPQTSFHNTSSTYDEPTALTTDAQGNVYADYGSYIVKFPAAGSITTVASGLSYSAGMAVDAAGNLYASDEATGNLYKIANGTTSVIATLTSPVGIAVDAAGNIYVVENNGNSARDLKKFTMSGGTITATTTIATGFNSPGGVAVDGGGNIYIVDAGITSIYEIPASVTSYPVTTSSMITVGSGFLQPDYVYVDNAGNLFVSDSGHGVIKEIAAGTGTITTVNTGTALQSPAGIAVDVAGNLYYGDGYNYVVYQQKQIGGYYVNPALPGGLTISSGTGTISGTPTTGSAAANYTVIGYNTLNNTSATAIVNIKTIDVNLSALTLSAGTLSPVFSATTTSYTANVNGTIASITVTPTLSDPTDTVKVNNVVVSSGSPSASLPLVSGSNIILVKVTAADGVTTNTYTLTVNSIPPPTISYSGPQVYSGGTAITPLAPTSSNVASFAYSSTLTTIDNSINTPTGVAVDAQDNLYVTSFPGGSSPSSFFKIAPPDVVSTLPGSYSEPYSSAVDAAGNYYVADGTNSLIRNGTVVAGSFSNPIGVATDAAGNVFVGTGTGGKILKSALGTGTPVTYATGFSSPLGVAVDGAGNVYVADYSTNKLTEISPAGVKTILSASLNTPSSVAVDGTGNLYVGNYQNLLMFSASAIAAIPSGNTTATAASTNIYPNASSNTNLWGVAVDAANNIFLTDFSTNATEEIAPVGGYFVSPELPAGLVFDNNTGNISGTPQASSPAINYTVTAYNSTGFSASTTVNITVLPTNANLSNLAINTGTLSPAFSSATTSYSASVTVSSITVTPTTADPAATVTVNGITATSGTASAVSLVSGSNSIPVVVTSGDGSVTQTYTLTVTFSPSAIATLSKLTISSGTLSPKFATATTSYTATVTTGTITITPTTTDATASVTVNGTAALSGSASPIALTSGSNTITVLVTAADGVHTDTYTVAVTYTPTSTLTAMAVSSGSLSPTFKSTTTTYTDAVTVNAISITPTTTDGAAVTTITSGSNTYASGAAIPLTVGSGNVINVKVTSGSSTQTYKVTVTYSLSAIATLSHLTISSGSISPTFRSTTTTYTASVTAGNSTINITPTTTDATASVTITNTTITSTHTTATSGSPLSVPLNVGANAIAVVVTAANGTTTDTYNLTITRATPPATTISSISAAGTSPTNAASVNYTVTFAASITGLSASNFTVTTTGNTTGTSIGTITGSGTTYTVPVNTGTGDGTLTLNLANATGLSTTISTTLPFAGDTYTIDKTPPAVTNVAFTSNESNPNTAIIGDLVTLLFTPTETLQGTPTVTIAGNTPLSLVPYGLAYSAEYTMQSTDAPGNIPYEIDMTDLAGNTAVVTNITTGVNLPFSTTPIINVTGTPLTALNTVSGTASGYTYFTFSGSNITSAGVTVTAPAGFEVSPDNSTYSPSFNIAQGNYTSSNVFVRLAAADVAGTYSGNVVLSNGATTVNVPTVSSTVTNPAGTITSIAAVTSSPTNAASVDFTVVFAQAVTGLSATNFTLTQGGSLSGASITSITGSGATYDVTVNTGSGNGTLALNFDNSTGLSANISNAPFTGDTYAIYKTPPTASPLYFSSNNANNAVAILGNTVTLVFGADEAIQTPVVTIGGHSVTAISTGGNNYTASYVMQSTDPYGIIHFTLSMTDLAGNTSTYNDVAAGDYVTYESTAAMLTYLALDHGTLSPAFNPATTSYTVSLASTYTQVNVGAVLNDRSASMTVNGTPLVSGSKSGEIPLSVGDNTIDVVVTPQDGSATQTYAIVVNRAAAAAATLSYLALNHGTLSPAFDPATTSYNVSLANSYTQVEVSAIISNPSSSMTVNGTPLASGGTSGEMPLSVGDNTINVVVTSQGGLTSQTYTLIVNRAAPPLTLSSLALNHGTLSPAFNPATTSYTDSLGYGYTQVEVSAALSISGSSMTVNGTALASGGTSGEIPLSVGTNTINVVVTSQDGFTNQTYTIIVNRAGPPLTLSSLALNHGTLSPAFNAATTGYNVSLAYGYTQVEVSAALSIPGTTMTVNGAALASGGTSGEIPLSVGNNTINVVVTSQDGTTSQTYAIVVNRAEPPTTLSYLALNHGTLSPAFSAATTGYNVSLAYGYSQVEVSAILSSSGTIMTVNGAALATGGTSGEVPLSVGNNTINVVVASLDGTASQTYAIVVNRAEPPTTLSYLALNHGTLSPAFNAANTSYTDSLSYGYSQVEVNAILSSSGTTMTVNGAALATGGTSGEIPLSVGNNTINVVVASQDSLASQTYTVIVNRAASVVIDAVKNLFPAAGNTELADDGVVVHPAVSPNGDGIDDVLKIDGLSAYPDNKLTIMNQGGTTIYEAAGYDNSSRVFDGHSNKTGSMQQPGTYFYLLQYKAGGKTKTKTGFIILKY
jgi:sugar lactone lactonase YvrE